MKIVELIKEWWGGADEPSIEPEERTQPVATNPLDEVDLAQQRTHEEIERLEKAVIGYKSEQGELAMKVARAEARIKTLRELDVSMAKEYNRLIEIGYMKDN